MDKFKALMSGKKKWIFIGAIALVVIIAFVTRKKGGSESSYYVGDGGGSYGGGGGGGGGGSELGVSTLDVQSMLTDALGKQEMYYDSQINALTGAISERDKYYSSQMSSQQAHFLETMTQQTASYNTNLNSLNQKLAENETKFNQTLSQRDAAYQDALTGLQKDFASSLDAMSLANKNQSGQSSAVNNVVSSQSAPYVPPPNTSGNRPIEGYTQMGDGSYKSNSDPVPQYNPQPNPKTGAYNEYRDVKTGEMIRVYLK